MIFSKKGLTLLEILVAVTLFSLMMVFITQIVRMSLRQQSKISGDVRMQREISNTLDVIFQDFNGSTTFFDFNKNLQQFYPLNKNPKDSSQQGFAKDDNSLVSFLINPEFDFSGEEQDLKFVTFSLIESKSGEMAYQLIKVHYFLEDCKDLKTDKQTQCLFRSVVSFRDDEEVKNKYVMLKGVQSLKFSYYDTVNKDWLREWKNHQEGSSPSMLLPVIVKMDVEWKEEKLYKKSYTFPLSSPLFRNQNRQLQKVLSFVRQKDLEEQDKEEEEKYFKKRILEDNKNLHRLRKDSIHQSPSVSEYFNPHSRSLVIDNSIKNKGSK